MNTQAPESTEPVEPVASIANGLETADDAAQTVSAGNPEPLEEAPFITVGDHIVVEEIVLSNETASGILIAVANAPDKLSAVLVVGAGPHAHLIVPESFSAGGEYVVQIGDLLIVHKHQMVGLKLPEDQRELQVLKPAAVIGIQQR